MPAVLRCPTCPICRAWIAPRAVACPACHAQRQSRHGMSLQAFQAYASLWLLCSAVVLLLAVRIAAAPWLFAPGLAVCLAVLALNFLGDGLRDAADPYAQEGR